MQKIFAHKFLRFHKLFEVCWPHLSGVCVLVEQDIGETPEELTLHLDFHLCYHSKQFYILLLLFQGFVTSAEMTR